MTASSFTSILGFSASQTGCWGGVSWSLANIGNGGWWIGVKWWALLSGSTSATLCLVGHLVVCRILSKSCCRSLMRGSIVGGWQWAVTAALWRRVQSPNALHITQKVSGQPDLKNTTLRSKQLKETYELYWVLWKAAAGWAISCFGWETGALFRRLSYSSSRCNARVNTLSLIVTKTKKKVTSKKVRIEVISLDLLVLVGNPLRKILSLNFFG